MKIIKFVITGVLVAAVLCSCNKDHKPTLKNMIGKTCHVQIKRDALGSASSTPVPVQTDNMNGADVAVVGILKQFDKESVTITQGNRETWIPKSSILLIQTDL